MCGIVGIVGPLADKVGDRWLDEAVGSLNHRGPDGHGTWRSDGIALGHTRLAIVDLSETGQQPMTSVDGTHVMVYNGEVYNHDRLAKPMRERGWRPRGHSDTEVVQQHLIGAGSAGLDDLDGMFALAQWSERERTLLLARDRAGIKPLYYAEIDGSVAFASELSVLMGLPGLDKRLDTEALSHFLALGMVPAPWTIVRGVRQLEAGSYVLARANELSAPRRFCHRIGVPMTEVPRDSRAQDRLLERLLLSAVRAQLEADVPVGVLLSGGVDSSVVAAAAARCKRDIRTFAVVHDDPAHDERHAARAVADHIGSSHTEIEMPRGGLSHDELVQLVAHHGDPFADSSSLPTRRLAHVVKQHVTVALSGDGGDELFAGYPRFWQQRIVEGANALPGIARSALHRGTSTLAAHLPNNSMRLVPRRIARATGLAQRSLPERAVGTFTWFWPEEQHELLRPAYRAPLESLAQMVESHAAPGVSLATADGSHRMEQHLTLPGDMLTKVDRMTMAESLEIRPVLLANDIVSFASGLPIERKLQGRECKSILRALARRWVPPEVIDRPKKGFSVPLVDYGGAVLRDATSWALDSQESPLYRLCDSASRASLKHEFARRGEGTAPEDSAYRRAHRQWSVTVLAMALQQLDVAL